MVLVRGAPAALLHGAHALRRHALSVLDHLYIDRAHLIGLSMGGYTALQRSALLQMAWDHVGSALDHRESVYELHANGGIPSWRGRLRRGFNRYEELANGVLQHLGLPMPKVDLQSIRNAPLVVRRPVNPTVPPPKPVAPEPARNPVTAGKVT